jgi:hypothetical protein
MDYTAGTDFVKPQWDAIHEPGLVIGMFERDEEGAMVACFAPEPDKPGTQEGQRQEVKFTSTIGAGPMAMKQECKEIYYFHIEDKPYNSCCDENGNEVIVQSGHKTGWYKEEKYCNEVIKPVLESFGILNGQVRALKPESEKIKAAYNLEQFQELFTRSEIICNQDRKWS